MSFKRAVSKSVADSKPVVTERISGIKPWINNQYFVSSGLRQLDEIIGGGIALGTMCAVEQDNSSNYAQIVFNYNITEALSHGHPVLLIVHKKLDALKQLEQLPYNLNYVGSENIPMEDSSKWIEINKEVISITGISKMKMPEFSFVPPISYEVVSSTGIVYCNSYDLSKRLVVMLLFNEVLV